MARRLAVALALVAATAVATRTTASITVHHHRRTVGVDASLLEWAAPPPPAANATSSDSDPFLLIGAKSSVVHGFAARQTLRATWASDASRPRGVRVVFLGCAPDLAVYPPHKQREIRAAVAREKAAFGDLLIDELADCVDSFAGLPHKVRAFFRWASASHPSLAFAMVTDDDIYLRVDALLTLLRGKRCHRLFLGNSASSERGLSGPTRDPRHKYSLSLATYPMRQFPPFLTGAHYLLSADLVHFVARNARDLRGLGALDDASVGLWLFATLGVTPTYHDGFIVLRSTKACIDEALSVADLTLDAIRAVHANVVHGQTLCHGFEYERCMKKTRSIVLSPDEHDATADATVADGSQQSMLHWDVQYDGARQRVQLQLSVTAAGLVVGFTYVPSQTDARSGLCAQATSVLRERLYLLVGQEVCAYYTRVLVAMLETTTHDESPAMRALLALAHHNLRRHEVEAAETEAAPAPVVVALTWSTRHARVLVECLFVEVFASRQVLVLDPSDDEDAGKAAVDAVVLSTGDDVDAALARSRVALLLLEGHARKTSDPRVVAIATEPSGDEGNELVVPLGARVFANTVAHTPLALLQRRDGAVFHPQQQQQHVGVVLCRLDTIVPIRHASDLLAYEELCRSADETSSPHGRDGQWRAGLFLDAAVARLTAYRFAFVVAAGADTNELLVAAFLAGCVPVVVPPASAAASSSAARSRSLFNAQAVIRCSALSSPENDCVERVTRVSESAELYDAMQREPPIVDTRAFADAFSWHPAVAERLVRSELGGERISTKLRQRLAPWLE